jgi:rhodanese-related sulfurtransferase
MKKITGNNSLLWMQVVSFGILATFCITFACYAQPTKATPSQIPSGQTIIIKKLPPKEGYELIRKNRANPDFVILDVRTPEEFESGHIEGAININYHSDAFTEDLNKLERSKTYLVYCRTGRRSGDTVGIMTKQGFKEIYLIDGDIVKWKALDLPVVKGTK